MTTTISCNLYDYLRLTIFHLEYIESAVCPSYTSTVQSLNTKNNEERRDKVTSRYPVRPGGLQV